MRNIKPTKIFFSAEREDRSAVDNAMCALAAFDLAKECENFDSVRECEGRFNGQPETTVIAFARPGCILEAIDSALEIARKFRQDSILVVHGDDAAELVECDTECSAIIGTFQRTQRIEPGEDFSIIDGNTYVVR